MILAGDVGGTSTRLAAYELAGGRLVAAAEATYRSATHASLNEIVAQFLTNTGCRRRRAVAASQVR